MTITNIRNTMLAMCVIAAWMYMAAAFDTRRLEGDQRHFADKQVEKRKQAAAQRLCGNGSPRWLDDVTLECVLHTGRGVSVVTAGVL